MSTWIEWAGVSSGPAGLALGILGKGMFDRGIKRSVSHRVDAETKLTEAQAPKIDAEAAKVIADTAVALVAPLREQINELVSRVETLETENSTSKAKLQVAFDYIVSLLRWISRHAPDKTPPAAPELLDMPGGDRL